MVRSATPSRVSNHAAQTPDKLRKMDARVKPAHDG
jgi:hypothetical protein